MKTLLNLAKIVLPLSLLLTVLAGLTCVPKGSPFKFQIPLERNLESNLLSNIGAVYTGNKTSDEFDDDRNAEIKAANEVFARTKLGGTGLAVGPENKLDDADKNKPRVYVWGRKPHIEGTLPAAPGFTPSAEATTAEARNAEFGNWLADAVDEFDNDRRNNLRKLKTSGLALAAAAPAPTPAPVPKPVVKTNPYFAMDVSKGAVQLTGALPSEDARRLLVTSAQNQFKGRTVTDKITIDPKGLNNTAWLGQTGKLITDFSGSVQGDTGFLGINRAGALDARGSGRTAASKAAFATAAAAIPGLAARNVNITAPAPVAPTPPPAPAPVVRTNPHFDMNVGKGAINLTGELPTAAAQSALLRQAQTSFPGRRIVNKTTVNGTSLNARPWTGQVGPLVNQFGATVQGDTARLGINPQNQLIAIGSCKNQAAYDKFAGYAGNIAGVKPDLSGLNVLPPPPPPKSPSQYVVQVNDNTVRLSGLLPTDAAKANLAATAKRAFPDRTGAFVDNATVGGAPATWVTGFSRLVDGYGKAVGPDGGTVSVDAASKVTVTGVAKTKAGHNNVIGLAGRIPGATADTSGWTFTPPPPPPKDPSFYSVQVGEKSVLLEGLLPSDASKASLASSVKRAFPGRDGSFTDNTTVGGAAAAWVPGFSSLVNGYGSAVDSAGGTVSVDASGNVKVTGAALTKAGHNNVMVLAAGVPGAGADTTGWTFTPPPPPPEPEPAPAPAPEVVRPTPRPVPVAPPAPVRSTANLPTIDTVPFDGARREAAPAPEGVGTVREIRPATTTGRIIQVPTGDGNWRTVDRPPASGEWRTIEGTIRPETYRGTGVVQPLRTVPLSTTPIRGTTQPVRGTTGDWRTIDGTPVRGTGTTGDWRTIDGTPIRGTGTSGDWRTIEGSRPVPVNPGGPRTIPMETTSFSQPAGAVPISVASVAATPVAASGVLPRISVNRGAGNWAVSGVVPSQADSDSILSAVTRSSLGQGGAQVVDRIKVDPGASRATWVGAYGNMLAAMREVQDAQLNVEGNRITLRGTVSGEDRKSAVAGDVRTRLGDSSCVIQNDLQTL